MILDKALPLKSVAIAIIAASMAGCGAHGAPAPVGASTGKMVAVCTISTLCSLVASVAGDAAVVRGIVPVGASPETYEPTPSDVVALSHARLLFENGLGLEAWMSKVLAAAGAADLTTVALSDSIPAAYKASGNPHLWMDPTFAVEYVKAIQTALVAADPANAKAYRANAWREVSRLTLLDRWIGGRIATIPKDRRAMICFHDAWYYFDRRYGIKNVGAIEPSPGQEPSPGYFAHLIELAKTNHVRAIFGEPQYSPKLAAALQTGAGIKVLDNLYDDTLGTGPALATYEEMMRYDVGVIVSALRS